MTASMEPRIRYARTADAVSIAYFTLGEGQPLLLVPPIPYSHLELGWADPGYRVWTERLARGKRLIYYDNRGSGLSERDIESFDLDSLVLDLEAVLDNLGLDQTAIFAISQGGSAAIAFAAKHPQRVTHLILWCPFDAETPLNRASIEAIRSVRDWELFTQTVAHSLLAGWENSDYARSYARLMRESVDPEPVFAGERTARFPVSRLLSSVLTPTLVIHRRDSTYPPLRSGRRIAAAIPNAELLVLEGGVLMPWVGDMESVVRPIERFLGIAEEPTVTAPVTARRPADTGTAVILFADIADSTALTERLGDLAFRTRARDLDRALRTVISDHGGTPIEGKLLGDGILAVFQSAREAIAAALFCGMAGAQAGLPLHLGLHAGDVIREDNNVYGGAVNIASRISGLAEPGEVLVSDIVRGLARTSAGVQFEDRGEQPLKGVGEAMRVWAVRGGNLAARRSAG